MKLTTFLLFIATLQISASGLSQDTFLTLSSRDVTMSELFEEIESQSNFKIFYKTDQIDVDRNITLNQSSGTIADILSYALKGSNIGFRVIDDVIVLTADSRQQQARVTGKVYDGTTNEPMAGVTIQVAGTTVGTVSQADGSYSVNLPLNGNTLVYRFVGYQTQEVAIEGRTVIDVVLKEEVIALDEVVVTGYQVQRKADLTGSVSVLQVDDIKDNSSGSALKSMQGKIPGVFLKTDGSPNGGVQTVYIRGLNTLGATDPLYIIDGVPTTSATTFKNLSPNSIASIQVLKDASSASIYGSRASNGVIIVTTKEGGKDKTSIRIGSSITSQKYVRTLSMMNTEQYGQAYWQASINDGTNPNNALYTYEWHTDGGVAVLDKITPVEFINGDPTLPSADTDWQDEVFRTGLISSTSLTINSGSANSSLMIDLNYYSNKGIVINNDYKKLTGRVNSSISFMNGRVKIGENMQLASSSEVPIPNDVGGESILNLATVILPILPVYKTDGTFAGPLGGGFSDRNNPVYMSEINIDDRRTNNQLFGNMFAEITPIKNFIYRSTFGVDFGLDMNKNIERLVKNGFITRTTNSLDISRNINFNWTWSNTINYQLAVGGHSATVLLGMEANRQKSDQLSSKREGFAIEDLDYYEINAGTGTSTNSGISSGNSLLSYFGKVNYGYRDKYLASATVRYDGSSRFGDENKFGWFPSASLGWVISRESFFTQALPFVSNLKLRIGLGRVGNQQIDNNAIFDLYSSANRLTAYDLNGVDTGTLPSGYYVTQTGNNKLKWESTNEINYGVDLGFLTQKITVSFDYFKRETKDILINPSFPGVLGAGGSKWVNGATVENRGWEVELGYRGKIGNDVNFDITGSVSHFADKITYLPASVVKSYAGNVEKTILGHSRTSYFGYVTDGLFQNQAEVDAHATQPGKGVGRIRYKDLNDDGTINTLDQDWLGTAIPDVEYGLNIGVTYKNLGLDMFIHGVQGIVVNDGMPGTNASSAYSKVKTDFMGIQSGVNKGTRVLDAWTPQNTSSTIPKASLKNDNTEQRSSDYFLVNGSYLKFATAQLTYTLPAKINQMLKLSESRVYISGENFLLIKDRKGVNAFTSPDPETPGYVYPQPVRFTLGIDVQF